MFKKMLLITALTTVYLASAHEDELASLFCHEYAHIYARHVRQGLKHEPGGEGSEDALLFAFAGHTHHLFTQIDIGDIYSDQLADADPGRVQKL